MLKIVRRYGYAKRSKTYKKFLVFDYLEGRRFLNDCKKQSGGVFSFVKKLIETRNKRKYTDARLDHALSSALDDLGYNKVMPGSLYETMQAIFINKKARKKFRNIFMNSTAKITYANRHIKLDRFIKGMFAKGHDIRYLDIGCCPGENGAVTSQDTQRIMPNAKITAIDVSFPRKFKPTNKKVRYVRADVTKVNLKSEYYDVIRFVNLELFLNSKTRKLVKAKLVNALKPGGYLISGREARGYEIYRKE